MNKSQKIAFCAFKYARIKSVVKRFQERPDYREKCFLSLQIDDTQIPKIINGVDLIATDLDLETTQSVFKKGLTQNHEKTNRKGRKAHEVIRVSEGSCVSPIKNMMIF